MIRLRPKGQDLRRTEDNLDTRPCPAQLISNLITRPSTHPSGTTAQLQYSNHQSPQYVYTRNRLFLVVTCAQFEKRLELYRALSRIFIATLALPASYLSDTILFIYEALILSSIQVSPSKIDVRGLDTCRYKGMSIPYTFSCYSA